MNRSTDFIPFARPSVGEEEEQAVLSVLRSGWLTTAGQTQLFEREFAERVGTTHALAVNSATAGLHLSLEAIGIGPGDIVLTTPYTFTASAEVARYLGAEVRFADIEEESLTIDPREVDRVLGEGSDRRGSDTRGSDDSGGGGSGGGGSGGRGGSAGGKGLGAAAMIPVHLGGRPCRMKELAEISDRYGVPIVEDAAHAFPVAYGERCLGTLGATGVYSFYATKTITTGEGGMVATDDEELARRIRTMRLHGIDREVWNRYTERGASWSYDVVAPGYKYNLPDMAAAVGRVQLGRADEFLRRRAAIARRYREAFADLDFLRVPAEPEHTELPAEPGHTGEPSKPEQSDDAMPPLHDAQQEARNRQRQSAAATHAWHLFILRIVEERLDIDRDRFIELLSDEGIGTSVHYIPLHLMSYYRKTYGFRPEDFPVSLRVYRSALSLPIYPALTDEQVEKIISAVRRIGEEHYRRVSR